MDTEFFHQIHFGVGGICLTRDNRPGMPHAPSRRRRDTGDEADHRLAHVCFCPAGRIHFLRATDLPDHDDGFGLGVVLKGTQHGDKISAIDRVATDTHRGGLPHAQLRHLLYRLIVQGTGTRHHADTAGAIDVRGHNANLAGVRGDDTRRIRADNNGMLVSGITLDLDHVLHRNTVSNHHHHADTGLQRFHNGIGRKRWRHKYAADICPGFCNRLMHRIENRQPEMLLATLARRDAANHRGAILHGLFGMKGGVLTGKSLNNDT